MDLRRGLRTGRTTGQGARSTGWRLSAAVSVAGLALVASACSSDEPEPDASHAGQVEYACALVDRIAEDDADIAEWTFTGDDTDAGVREMAAVSSLVGASAGFVLEDHPELSEAGRDAFMGLSRIDTDMLQEGLDRLSEQCADVSPSSDIDVTPDGQIQYACALTDHVMAEHGAADSWAGLGETHAWHEAASVGAFLGAATGQMLSGHADSSDAGAEIFNGIMILDTAQIESGLAEVSQQCQQ